MKATRCPWCLSDPLYVLYHDQEWGVPLYDDQRLFESIVLDGAQAGLSWITVLRKRENYRRAFYDFKIARVANMGAADIDRLLHNPGIIRNALKIRSAITNAQATLKIQSEFGSLSNYLWQFTGGKPQINQYHSLDQLPATNEVSLKMSTDLQKRGFKFVGPTICYAFMQASGMVNDHLTSCFRYNQLVKSVA